MFDLLGRRRQGQPVIDQRLTQDDIRRADELIDQYGLDFLREDGENAGSQVSLPVRRTARRGGDK